MGVSRTEQLARDLMRHYHPELKLVFGVRPAWLQNPATGHALELDIFIPGLQSAIEIQGTQHYRHTPGLQDTPADFQKQLDHDSLKVALCAEWGVRLYHLDAYRMTRREFPKFLRRFEQDNRLLPSRAGEPTELYAIADRLSRRKIQPVKQEYIQPSIWQSLWEWLRS